MPEVQLVLEIPPRWEQVERVRQAVLRLFDGDPLATTVAMVAAELLENAVKYGSSSARIRLHVRADDDGYQVAVANRRTGETRHAERLNERLGWLESFDNTADAYLEVLTTAANRLSSEDESSGLGLVRIAYEGRCSLEADWSDDELLTLRAHHNRKESAMS